MGSTTDKLMSSADQGYFAANLKHLLNNSKLNQKQFAKLADISESTLSGYLRGNKQPNIAFLVKLKEQFPDISIDQLLFEPINDYTSDDTLTVSSQPLSDLDKYYGTYYLYYLDTSKKNISRPQDNPSYSSIELRLGILYICKDNTDTTSSKARCLAVFGIRNRAMAKDIKIKIESLDKFNSVSRYLKEEMPHALYSGKLSMSQQHFFVSLNKQLDNKDFALIVLHHTESNKDSYFGGLGTINSASTGRASDPIVQRIALSRHYAYISDEQIKAQLRFSVPKVSTENGSEASQILHLAELMFKQDPTSTEQNPYGIFSPQNIKTLLNSCLESLIANNLENNQLWFGRVSTNDDDAWYHLLMDSEADHNRRIEGNSNDAVSS